MADDQAAYLRELEEEGDRPRRVRQFLPRRVIVKKGGGGLNVTVALADGQSSPVNAGPINFTVTFNKPVTGVDALGQPGDGLGLVPRRGEVGHDLERRHARIVPAGYDSYFLARSSIQAQARATSASR